MKSNPRNVAERMGSEDYLIEHAYLVERGVRALAIVAHIIGDSEDFFQVESRLRIVACTHGNVIPFVVVRGDGVADCGFAAAKWAVDLYEWLMQNPDVPDAHSEAITGLLLGYSPAAIRDHLDRNSGGRFVRKGKALGRAYRGTK